MQKSNHNFTFVKFIKILCASKNMGFISKKEWPFVPQKQEPPSLRRFLGSFFDRLAISECCPSFCQLKETLPPRKTQQGVARVHQHAPWTIPQLGLLPL